MKLHRLWRLLPALLLTLATVMTVLAAMAQWQWSRQVRTSAGQYGIAVARNAVTSLAPVGDRLVTEALKTIPRGSDGYPGSLPAPVLKDVLYRVTHPPILVDMTAAALLLPDGTVGAATHPPARGSGNPASTCWNAPCPARWWPICRTGGPCCSPRHRISPPAC